MPGYEAKYFGATLDAIVTYKSQSKSFWTCRAKTRNDALAYREKCSGCKGFTGGTGDHIGIFLHVENTASLSARAREIS